MKIFPRRHTRLQRLQEEAVKRDAQLRELSAQVRKLEERVAEIKRDRGES